MTGPRETRLGSILTTLPTRVDLYFKIRSQPETAALQGSDVGLWNIQQSAEALAVLCAFRIWTSTWND